MDQIAPVLIADGVFLKLSLGVSTEQFQAVDGLDRQGAVQRLDTKRVRLFGWGSARVPREINRFRDCFSGLPSRLCTATLALAVLSLSWMSPSASVLPPSQPMAAWVSGVSMV